MPTWLPTLIFVPLVGFGLYRRFRSAFGRQPFKPKRTVARMVVLVLLMVLFTLTNRTSANFAAAGAGLAAGVVLGFVALGRTKFEKTAEGAFFTPDRWIGLAVTALFIGRLVARMAVLYAGPALEQMAAQGGGVPRSPLTTGLFLLMAGYYVLFYGGVLNALRDRGASRGT